MPAYHRVPSDRNELMNCRQPADNRPLFDRYVTPHLDRVGNNNIVADCAIVGNMNVRHQQTIAADSRFHVFSCPAIERAKFPDCCSVADLERCFFVLEFQILRKCRDNRPFVYSTVFSDSCAVSTIHVRAELRSIVDDNIAFDDRVWTNGYVVAELGFGIE